jgi:hypothetical protein
LRTFWEHPFVSQSKYISEGTQKWTLLGSKVVPPGGPVFGPSFCQMCWSFASCYVRKQLYGLFVDPPKLLLMHIDVMMMLPLH